MGSSLREADIETPAFVYDEHRLATAARRIAGAASRCGCRLLYTLKPLSFVGALRVLAEHVAGFAAASAFEAALAREVLGPQGTVHLTSPGLRQGDLLSVRQSCNYISFNSLDQLVRYRPLLGTDISFGIRVNPQMSFVDDPRYDPCRPSSRLGVPLTDLVKAFAAEPAMFEGVAGLHFHSNCDSEDFTQLGRTLRHVHATLKSGLFERIRWLNLGGGYLFDSERSEEGLRRAVELPGGLEGVELFVEPGAALVREAGSVVATVLELMDSDGQTIAVLDTTVNHMPEVFEYQFEPDVLDHTDHGRFKYTLAGCSCLAGDVFGQYAFDYRLDVGARVVFTSAGAYSLVKAHMFNGINLPAVYARTPSGQLVLKKKYGYEDFTSRSGVTSHDHSSE